ncbi:hypothetical protein PHYC_00707 [Phycisphaerales bacterium]|nr:hypothetical protein PHYC_00707 [Phycisphaerales bacterium]
MGPAPLQNRQMSSASLGGVTLLLVVAFALQGSAGLRDTKIQCGPRSETSSRLVATREHTIARRELRRQTERPAAKVLAEAARSTIASRVVPMSFRRQVDAACFLPLVLKTDLPPPARA